MRSEQERHNLLEALAAAEEASIALGRCVKHGSNVLVEASHCRQDADELRHKILALVEKLDDEEPTHAPD